MKLIEIIAVVSITVIVLFLFVFVIPDALENWHMTQLQKEAQDYNEEINKGIVDEVMKEHEEKKAFYSTQFPNIITKLGIKDVQTGNQPIYENTSVGWKDGEFGIFKEGNIIGYTEPKGYLKIEGIITNIGNGTAFFVNLQVLGYDTNNKTIIEAKVSTMALTWISAHDNAYWKYQLGANQTAKIDACIYYKGNLENYTITPIWSRCPDWWWYP